MGPSSSARGRRGNAGYLYLLYYAMDLEKPKELTSKTDLFSDVILKAWG